MQLLFFGQCSPSKAGACPRGEIITARQKKSAARGGRELHSIFFLMLSEVIVHAGSNNARAVSVCGPGDAEATVGEVDIEIFDLGTPIRSKAELGSRTQGPAHG